MSVIADSRPDRNGLGLFGSSQCGGGGLLLALAPSGDALLATVGNLKALPHILCPVYVWCCQVGFILSHNEITSPVCLNREVGELADHRLGMNARLGGGPGRGNLGSSNLLEARLDTQTLDLAPAVQEPLLDPASLDLEASTLSRSFHRQKGSSREEEGVLVSIEAEPPCEASKLSQVQCVCICL